MPTINQWEIEDETGQKTLYDVEDATARAVTDAVGGIQVRPNFRIEPDTTSTIDVGDPLPTGTLVFIYEAS